MSTDAGARARIWSRENFFLLLFCSVDLRSSIAVIDERVESARWSVENFRGGKQVSFAEEEASASAAACNYWGKGALLLLWTTFDKFFGEGFLLGG